MRRLVAGLLILLAAVVGPAPYARGEDAPVARSRLADEVERCLKDLTSDDYATREAARKRLQGISREARALLEARREDPDPEVRRTVESLLAEIGDTGPAPVPAGELGGLGLVTFRGEGTFAEVASAWEREVGGRLRIGGVGTDARVQAAVEGVPYFDALAAILAPAGLDLVDGFDEAGQALLVVRGAAAPTASAGPFRLDVDSVTTTRSLRPGVRPRHSLLLRLVWAPHVQVTSFSTPEVVRAVDEAGGEFRGADGRGTTYGIGGGRRIAMLQVSLDPDEGTKGETLATLETKARIRLRHDRHEAVFTDLASTVGWPRSVEDAGAAGKGRTKVVLESFGPDPDRRGWVMGVLTATLARGIAPEGVGAALETSDGTIRPMLELSSRVAASDGVLRMTLRAAGVGPDVQPKQLRVSWYAAEQEVSVPFVLRGIPLR